MNAALSNLSSCSGYVPTYTGGYLTRYQSLPNYDYVQYTYPVIDYDLLAEKIVEKLKGKESRSIEEVRKELNKLLDEVAKKEKDKKD